jgi:hypothetical protein
MARIEIDDSRYPLLIARFPSDVTSDDFADYSARLFPLLSRGRCALLVDAGEARLTPEVRRLMADEMRQREAVFVEHCAGCAVVLRSTITRGIMTALTWLVTPKFPLRTFAHEEMALAWLKERLATAGA